MRHTALLLGLATALVGFVVLLNMLPPMDSPEARSIQELTGSNDDPIRLPSGAGFLTYSVLAVSLVLGVAAILAFRNWRPTRNNARNSLPAVIGGLLLVCLIAAGLYLALSGTFTQDVTYEEHLVDRSSIGPGVLVALAGAFFSAIIAGILFPRLLLAALAVLLLAAIILWTLSLLPVNGSEASVAEVSQGDGRPMGIPVIPAAPPDPGVVLAIVGMLGLALVAGLAAIMSSRSPAAGNGPSKRSLLMALLLAVLLAAFILWLLSPASLGGGLTMTSAGTGNGVGASDAGNAEGGQGEVGDLELSPIASTNGETFPFEPESGSGAATQNGVVPEIDATAVNDHQGVSEAEGRVDTETVITDWPTRVPRRTTFTVGGTVNTLDGDPVQGIVVEVYVNDTKEHGGTKIGIAESSNGIFEVEAQMPAGFRLGAYQLLARAVPNSNLNESWSDPDITVVSSSGLEITGPAEVPVEVEAHFRGKLKDDTGEGIPGIELDAVFDGDSGTTLITDSAGQFSFFESFSEPGPHWVEVSFEGDDILSGTSARLAFDVNIPTKTTIGGPPVVGVGEEFRVVGKLQNIHGEPLAGNPIVVRIGDGQERSALTDGSGEFEVTGEAEDAGEVPVWAEFAGEPPVLPSTATTRLVAHHTLELTLHAPYELRPGGVSAIEGKVISSTLSPVGRLELTVEDSEGNLLATVTTEEDGGFEAVFATPENLPEGPVIFKYSGDDLTLPVSYLLTFAEGSEGPGWQIWLGVPVGAAALVIAVFLYRRASRGPIPAVFKRRPTARTPEKETPEVPEEPVAQNEARPVRVVVRFVKVADDLPDVWGLGETVNIEVELTDSDGQPIAGAGLEASVNSRTLAPHLQSDDTGTCNLRWNPEELGEYVVSAKFAGSTQWAQADATRVLRVVDFREEIIRLYNLFLEWAGDNSDRIDELSTPREVEQILVGEGLTIDDKALDEVISLFEEADYSEHFIARRHYERMFRAWRKIVEGQNR